MSFAGLFKAAAASSKTAKLIKGAKGVFTIMEVIDTALDVGQLGDEIARAIMGDNYSPALRDLAQEVTDLGVIFDEKMAAIAQANTDITNLKAGIDSLTEIQIDYGDRRQLVNKNLQKLDQLKQLLSTTSPTTYSWFSTLRATAANEVPNTEQLEAIKEVIGPDFALIGMHSGMLGLRAAYVGYTQYQKRKIDDAPTGRPRSNAFSGGDPETMKRALAVSKAKHRKLKHRAKTVGKITLKGVTKLVTVGSFGMNIYAIVSKVNQHEAAMVELRKMRDRYQTEIPLYEQALNGVPQGNAAALEKFAAFFELDISSQSTKDSLYEGYQGTINEYEATVATLLGQQDSITPNINEADGIAGAYTAMIQKFKETQALASDRAVIQSLEASYNKFQSFKPIALNTKAQSETRKNEGLDPIKTEFISSVSTQLNTILSTLSVQIDDHNSLNMLITRARKLSDQANVKGKIQEIKSKFPEASPDLLQFLLQQELSMLAKAKTEEAKAMLQLLNIAAPERSQFKNKAAIETAIDEIIKRLPTTTDSVTPLENLRWTVEGPGKTAVKPDDATSSVSYEYALSGPSVWTRQTWIYHATAPTASPIEFDWNYSGFHAWYRPFVQISAFVDSADGRKYATLLEGSKREGSGQSHLKINKGETFGFIVKGSNYDRDSRLLGTLKVDFKD